MKITEIKKNKIQEQTLLKIKDQETLPENNFKLLFFLSKKKRNSPRKSVKTNHITQDHSIQENLPP